MKNLILAVCIFLIFELTSLAQDTHTISVEVTGISQIEGKIKASLTNDATNFPGISFATSTAEVDVEADVVTFTFTDIPADEDYAIVLFQDLNANGELDMNGNMPAEPFGFSNYVMMGPPSWEACSFNLDQDTTLSIKLYSF